MTLSQLDIIQLLAGYHSLLLCLALAARKRLRGLMVLVGTFGLHMLTNLGVSEGYLGPELDITSAFGLVYGPAFYFFVLGIVEQDRRFDLRDLGTWCPPWSLRSGSRNRQSPMCSACPAW